MAPRRPAELYRAPFPLYTVRLHPRRALAITAGGGGAAKTGIRNGVHFLQLERIGGRLSASLLHSHDTETRATMSMALGDGDVIAAGQDASCHILRFSLRTPDGKAGSAARNGSAEKGPRKRKGPSAAGQGETQSQTSEVTVESLRSVRTDFGPDALQKAVRFNADCSLLVTGGADGFLRLWEHRAQPDPHPGSPGRLRQRAGVSCQTPGSPGRAETQRQHGGGPPASSGTPCPARDGGGGSRTQSSAAISGGW
ncbi:guanine nucleotide-exchange factor SEC12 [Opisthocomus hoazin]|uniref:guanine nucleotide-exchange factor SEC12 n=1 Tax=Opisthocomus hoazin TaxID=30419 RepID=UPI003F537B62